MMALREFDPEIWNLCVQEKERQFCGLEMIASENFASQAVLEALSSSFHNKYSEGKVGARYYGGNQYVDAMESLCQQRALDLFNLDPDEWGVNVQPYSGSPANLEVFTALAGIHGRIMGLDLPDGGHLTHGFQTASGKKVSATSLFFESMPYKVDPQTGLIDYDQLQVTARLFRPKIIIAGTSAYSRHLDYARFRAIADSVSAILLADMAHISGLVAAGLHPSPFLWCDVVTTTTHKTLRGPRGAMIFYRKVHRPSATKAAGRPSTVTTAGHPNTLANGRGDVGESPTQLMSTDYGTRINEAVFPGMQGGPHNNTICALAVALREAACPSFKAYQLQVLANMQQLCSSLLGYGYYIVTGGSDTHVCLVDLRAFKHGEPLRDGALAEKVLEIAGITVNKNTCPGDISAFRPGGIRLGTPALTSRGMTEVEIIEVASLIHRALQLAKGAQTKAGVKKKMEDILKLFTEDEELNKAMKDLVDDVKILACRFPLPGMPDY